MRITLEADYALRIMCLLQNSDSVIGAGIISEKASVPPRFTLKILRKLSQGGFVRSFKGASGGYIKQDGAGDHTLCDIIELIDGPLVISRCVGEESCCSLVGQDKRGCTIHHIFSAVSDDIAQRLGRIKIADVADKNADVSALISKLRE